MNVSPRPLSNSDADRPRRVLVAVVHNQPVVYAQAARSLVEIGWGNRVGEAKALHGIAEICFEWQAAGPRVDVLRNQAVRDARHLDATHLLFLDADMTFPNDLLPRFLAHVAAPWQIVGGLYILKTPPFAPVALVHERREADGLWWFDHVDLTGTETTLCPVDVIGMGCTLIPMEAFDGPEPWFYYRDDPEGEGRVSEDVAFCQDVRARGFTIWLDPTVHCGHLGLEQRDIAWWYEFRRLRAACPLQVEA